MGLRIESANRWWEAGVADAAARTPWANAPLSYEAYRAAGGRISDELALYWQAYNLAIQGRAAKLAGKDTDWYQVIVHRRPDEVASSEWGGGSLEEARAKAQQILAESPPVPQTGSVFRVWIKSLGPHSEGGFYEKVAAGPNPYTQENNPFAVDHPAPGTPNDMFDGPPHTPEPMSVPVTTKPRQLPGAAQAPGGEAPEDEEPEEGELPSLTGSLLSFYCMGSGQKFASRFDPSMACVCGLNDYDLDLEPGIKTVAQDDELDLTTAEGRAKEIARIERALNTDSASRVLDVLGHPGYGEGHAERSLQLWINHPDPEVTLHQIVFTGRKTAMEGDPPWGMVDEYFPDMDEIETSEQFGVPFQENGPEGLQDQPFTPEGDEVDGDDDDGDDDDGDDDDEVKEAKKVGVIARDILMTNPEMAQGKALRLAKLTTKKYPVVGTPYSRDEWER